MLSISLKTLFVHAQKYITQSEFVIGVADQRNGRQRFAGRPVGGAVPEEYDEAVGVDGQRRDPREVLAAQENRQVRPVLGLRRRHHVL